MNHTVFKNTKTAVRLGFLAVTIFSQIGCTPQQARLAGEVLNPLLQQGGQIRSGTPQQYQQAPQPATKSGNSLLNTEIAGIFKKYPIANGLNPERWPRVAVTITSATPAIYELKIYNNPVTVNDCISYNVRVWYSANNDKKFDNLQLCADELYNQIKGIPTNQLTLWANRMYWPGDQTTGIVRTDGPTPPSDLFPSDPVLQKFWMDNFTSAKAFVTGVMTELG